MSKKILILSTSLRNRSNSEALADAFAEGAKRAGHTVQTRTLRGKSIAFC
ncbi:flavodoxin family protein [Yeguia hominis]